MAAKKLFAVGLLAAAAFGAWVLGRKARVRLIAAANKDDASAAAATVPAAETDGRLFIAASPQMVYETARELRNLPLLVPLPITVSSEGLNEDSALVVLHSEWGEARLEVSVVADQPGEYVGWRVDCDGALCGTWLLVLDTAPGDTGTVARVVTRVKAVPEQVRFIADALANTEVNGYLLNLKGKCENSIARSA